MRPGRVRPRSAAAPRASRVSSQPPPRIGRPARGPRRVPRPGAARRRASGAAQVQPGERQPGRGGVHVGVDERRCDQRTVQVDDRIGAQVRRAPSSSPIQAIDTVSTDHRGRVRRARACTRPLRYRVRTTSSLPVCPPQTRGGSVYANDPSGGCQDGRQHRGRRPTGGRLDRDRFARAARPAGRRGSHPRPGPRRGRANWTTSPRRSPPGWPAAAPPPSGWSCRSSTAGSSPR